MLALDPQVLDDAAARIDSVAASLSCLDVAGPFRVASDALPGSATAEACWWVATELDAAVDAWADGLVALCETARRVAHDLAATDASVASGFRAGPS
ncbi:hypothetical protein [Nocardioides sp. GXQ0305]|uniref:hypothetical protein n=1 Tax=Nocardioides sp. GXQ0305 TaxID=3423912 RepID=UPI003D7D09CE